MRLAGKTVFITGASRGIGKSTAKAFANCGANVALFARDEETLMHTADEIGTNSLPIAGDIADYSQISSAMENTIENFGGIDVLINNAATIKPIAQQADAHPHSWAQLIDVNIKGVFYANHCALPGMVKKGRGTIITVSSGAANYAIEGWSAYCTSKAGAAMLTACTDHEYRHRGIRAMGLSPGTVATQMQKDIQISKINPVSKLRWSDHIPPEWPAKAMIWMCSAGSDKYIGKEVKLRDPAILDILGLQ